MFAPSIFMRNPNAPSVFHLSLLIYRRRNFSVDTHHRFSPSLIKKPHFLHLFNCFYPSIGKKSPKGLFFQKIHLRPHPSYFVEFSTGSESCYSQPPSISNMRKNLMVSDFSIKEMEHG